MFGSDYEGSLVSCDIWTIFLLSIFKLVQVVRHLKGVHFVKYCAPFQGTSWNLVAVFHFSLKNMAKNYLVPVNLCLLILPYCHYCVLYSRYWNCLTFTFYVLPLSPAFGLHQPKWTFYLTQIYWLNSPELLIVRVSLKHYLYVSCDLECLEAVSY